ncbi:MAG: hypothetical protein ACTTJV_03050 [Ottowia sp.]
MPTRFSPSLPSFLPRALAALALTLAAAGCVHRPPLAQAAPDEAPAILTYPVAIGQWRALGHAPAPWLAGEMPVPVASAPTRMVGLQKPDGRWLALLIVQTAPAQSAGCTALHSLHVPHSGDRQGCLRMRRDALFDNYLPRQHAALWSWLQQRGIENPPAAWVAARVPDGQRLLEVHALLEPNLLEAVTRSNEDFLAAGKPGQDWANALARAARAAANGQALVLPPFPYTPASPGTPPEAPAKPIPVKAPPAEVPPPPSQAEQVPPKAQAAEAPPPAPAAAPSSPPATEKAAVRPKPKAKPAKKRARSRRCSC